VRFIIEFLATGFYLGYIPFASGTFGTILGLLIWVLLSQSFFFYIIVIVFTISGFLISNYAEKYLFNEKDSRKIVIDEIVGILITFVAFKFALDVEGCTYLASGFILFRFFDILKPFPIKNMQKLNGGIGIMLDDIASGVLSNIILQFIRLIFFN